MIVEWLRVGFVHGVMNTDNMSILGLTIDYGPYGWLEDYDPDWTPNTTDAGGKRYRYGYQPPIAQWNLLRLANAFFPAVGAAEPLQEAMDTFVPLFEERWHAMLAAKMGLPGLVSADDEGFVQQLFTILQSTETDMTIWYRGLADVAVSSTPEQSDDDLLAPLLPAYYRPDELVGEVRAGVIEWLRDWSARVVASGVSDEERNVAMNAVNPKYVLRNYLAQTAIDASEAGDHALVNTLLDVLRNPYDDQPGMEQFAEKRPEWARTRPGCSMLSCSS